jgi:hypothetical protein
VLRTLEIMRHFDLLEQFEGTFISSAVKSTSPI